MCSLLNCIINYRQVKMYYYFYLKWNWKIIAESLCNDVIKTNMGPLSYLKDINVR